jgi:hypothetical protein
MSFLASRERFDDQQATNVVIGLLRNAAQPFPATNGMLPWNKTKSRGHLLASEE